MKYKMVLAVDFDGTVSLGQYPNTGPVNSRLVQFLKQRKQMGDKLILWTCREGVSLQNAIDFCRHNDLEFDAINDNLPETIEKYGSNSRKISCDYYIDDRAVAGEIFERIPEIWL